MVPKRGLSATRHRGVATGPFATFPENGGTATTTIASLTVTGDAMCKATPVTYRLDTRAAHDFIGPFLQGTAPAQAGSVAAAGKGHARPARGGRR